MYREYEESFLEWCAAQGKPLNLSTLNAGVVREYSGFIRGRNGGKRDGEYAARASVSTLKVWSHFLVDEGVLEADYLSHLKLPKVTVVARQAYQAWEVQALRGALAEGRMGTRDVAMLAFLIDTGLRVGELVRLSLDDVDLKGRRVMVYGKGRLERVVPFGDSNARDGGGTVRRLRAYLGVRQARRELRSPQRDRFWMSYDGRPLGAQGVRELFQKAARLGGVSHHEVHACRHTFAVRYLVKNPGDVEGLRYVLGHMSQDMYRTYAGQAGALIAELAGRSSIADAMFGDGGSDSPIVPITNGRPRPILINGVGPPSGEKVNGRAVPSRRGKDTDPTANQTPRGGRRLKA